LWFWTTPIIYLKDIISQKYPYLLSLNPFFYFVDTYHDIFVYSKAPSPHHLFIITAMTIVSLITAAYLYKKMTSTIKDII
jgi:lipopolysaccharide transport system permease protein